MGKILDFIKEKSYYLLGGTVILIIVIILISACSGNKMGTYESIENEMVRAAKSYYTSNENLLPKEDGGIVKVSISTLVDLELIDEVIDPKNESQTCSGYVEVTKVSQEYSYTPFLTCSGNYEPKYLTDLIKETTLDEYGNGVYEMNGEYIYRGDEVKNYVSFNDQLWRILKVNENNEIKLIASEATKDRYQWDAAFNIDKNAYVGITTDYLNTNMRKVLLNYYEINFSTNSKALIVKKDLCIGTLSEDEDFNKEKECSIIKEQEYIGLMNVSDYVFASLDANCSNPNQKQCTNRNYLAVDSIKTWIMNPVEGNTYKMFYCQRGEVSISNASNTHSINPVIYLSNKTIASGKGTIEEPFIIK